MSTRSQELILGFVVLTFIGLAVGTVLFIYPSLGVDTRTMQVAFRHDRGVAPVQVASPVLLSGAMQVGKVTGIEKRIEEYVPGEGTGLWIVLTLEIETNLTMYKDCEIATDQPPVGGAGIVVIRTVGTPRSDLVQDDAIIIGEPAQSLAATIGDLSRRLIGKEGFLDRLEWLVDPAEQGSLVWSTLDLLDDVKAMTSALRTELDVDERASLLAKVHGIMDELQTVALAVEAQVRSDQEANLVAKLNTALDGLSAALLEAQGILTDNRPLIAGAMNNVEQTTRKLNNELMPQISAELNPDNPKSLLGKVHASMNTLQASLENVEGLTDAGQEFVITSTPALERTLSNVLAMSQTLKLASEELRAAPWRLIRFTNPSAAEEQDLDVLEAARTFAEAATYLDDTAARLDAILKAGGQRPNSTQQAEIERIRASLKAAFERFEQAEAFFFEKLK